MHHKIDEGKTGGMADKQAEETRKNSSQKGAETRGKSSQKRAGRSIEEAIGRVRVS